MHAAWLVAGGAGLLPKARFYDVSRPLKPGDSGRPEERVREVSVGFLKEDVVQRFKKPWEHVFSPSRGTACRNLPR